MELKPITELLNRLKEKSRHFPYGEIDFAIEHSPNGLMVVISDVISLLYPSEVIVTNGLESDGDVVEVYPYRATVHPQLPLIYTITKEKP